MKAIKQQKILALETCTSICSVALWDGEQLHEQVIETERSHSKKILPMCDNLLREANLSMRELDAIACTRGPGAFTGVRIGVGVAKGLAYGQDLPIYALSSLQVLAYRVMQNSDATRVVALLDARMGELYSAEYDNRDGVPCLLGAETLTDVAQLNIENQLFAGTGAHEYAEPLKAKGAILSPVLYPTAAEVIGLVLRGEAEKTEASALAPVYLRDKVTD